MIKRKTLKNITRLFTRGIAPLLPKPRRKRRAARVPEPAKVKVPARWPAATVNLTGTRLARDSATLHALERGTAGGRWLKGYAIAASGRRRYRLFLPATSPAGERIPVMVMLHGCGQNAARFGASTRMHQLAAREGFAVLYPEQARLANPQGCWNWFNTRHGRAQAEVGLILQAIDQVCQLHGGDRTRVAIAGLSAGAGMAALVATLHPERFKAVAMHSGVPPGTADSTMSALRAMAGHGETAALDASAAWPALLVIQGGDDKVVAPRNAEAAVKAWATALGGTACAPRQVKRGLRHAMQITDYRMGRRTVVRLVEIAALGHAWSGGAASQAYVDAAGPDASRLVWGFAAQQF